MMASNYMIITVSQFLKKNTTRFMYNDTYIKAKKIQLFLKLTTYKWKTFFHGNNHVLKVKYLSQKHNVFHLFTRNKHQRLPMAVSIKSKLIYRDYKICPIQSRTYHSPLHSLSLNILAAFCSLSVTHLFLFENILIYSILRTQNSN